MITKNFTDIEQSRKLAEILPIESADQTWARIVLAGMGLDIPEEMQYRHGDVPFQDYSGIGVPCWSLAALIERMPERLRNKDKLYCFLGITKHNSYYHIYYEYENNSGFYYASCEDTLIDACYKMILKLHEQNEL